MRRSKFVVVGLLLSVLVIVGLCLPFVLGTTETLYVQNTVFSNGMTSLLNDDFGYGTIAIAGNDKYLSSVSFKITNRYAGNAGMVRACLLSSYTSNGGNGTRVENSSNSFNLAYLGYNNLGSDENYTWVNFQFSGTVKLAVGTTYYVGLMNYGLIYGQWKMAYQITGTNSLIKDAIGNAWATEACTPNFKVYVYDTSGGSADPAGVGTDLLGDVDWAGAMSWIAVLLLMLVPTFILGVYMRGGKWGFLLGLGIGTGLSYFVFPVLVPIWLVILVAIGLGAAFLTSVKEGG